MVCGLRCDMLVISVLVHQIRRLASVLDLDEPPILHRRAVHQCWLVAELFVDLDNFAIYWSVNLADSLHALKSAQGLLSLEGGTRLRQIAEDHLAQLALRKITNTENTIA